MLNPKLPEAELLKSILQPLLEDFRDWFGRSATLLETEEIAFLTRDEQSDLLARVKQAQQEVSAANALFHATGGQVGIETATLMPWHRLLAECWKVSARFRSEQSAKLGK
ncbi:DUF2605 domain-containing protein [Tychonema sp. BBK16]|uniref:DUF2605 domain-containing protein n=1 Tax=Tychonema sp. BBK16 TaxID=2699888 RepID=UPI001F230CF5|nr:DUF2605 domain-containing protein [Tychonema sp. BBK16]MCF6373090.1 DUF2605 domain-containing protein [Tychonema sp. BBK16]